MQVEIGLNFTDFAIDFNDIFVFFMAVLYAVIVLLIADQGRRQLNLGSEFTRRIVHLFAGGAIWFLPFFSHAWVATLVAVLFVIMLGLANQERFSKFFAAMARPEDLEHGSVRGPFWYAVSITLLTAIFTFTGNETIYFLAAASIHIMMFGDGMSAPIGMKYGQNSTRIIFGSKRSTHGCFALFLFGFFGTLLAFWWFGLLNFQSLVIGGTVPLFELILIALSGALSGMLIELVSPKGTDNTTVPLLTCLVMLMMSLFLGIVTLPL